MKTLLIERVQNGWIVRPFTPGLCGWATTDYPQIFVFKTVEEMCEALPGLLAEFKITEAKST